MRSGRRFAGALAQAGQQATADAASRAAREVSERLTADLDDRDPDHLREQLPLLWLIASFWFRGEVRELGEHPRGGPVLMVGNHSGGNMTPDTFIFTLAFSTYFGVERRLPPARPQPRPGLAVRPPAAQRRDRRRVARERPRRHSRPARRCSSIRAATGRSTVRPGSATRSTSLAGRASSGWRSTPACRSSRSSRSAARRRRSSSPAASGSRSALRLDRLLRLKILPITLALPWGVNIGDFLGHLPLPAKITVEVMDPIDLREQFGDIRTSTGLRGRHRAMQDDAHELASERQLPVIG